MRRYDINNCRHENIVALCDVDSRSAAPDRPYHPAYVPAGCRDWHDFGGGSIGGMECHVCDTANWALRLHETGPTSVEALINEGMTDENFPRTERIRWEFPTRGDLAPVTPYWHDGGLAVCRA